MVDGWLPYAREDQSVLRNSWRKCDTRSIWAAFVHCEPIFCALINHRECRNCTKKIYDSLQSINRWKFYFYNKFWGKSLTIVHKYGKYSGVVHLRADVKSYVYEVHFSNRIVWNIHHMRKVFDHRVNEFACDFRGILDELQYNHTHCIWNQGYYQQFYPFL